MEYRITKQKLTRAVVIWKPKELLPKAFLDKTMEDAAKEESEDGVDVNQEQLSPEEQYFRLLNAPAVQSDAVGVTATSQELNTTNDSTQPYRSLDSWYPLTSKIGRIARVPKGYQNDTHLGLCMAYTSIDACVSAAQSMMLTRVSTNAVTSTSAIHVKATIYSNLSKNSSAYSVRSADKVEVVPQNASVAEGCGRYNNRCDGFWAAAISTSSLGLPPDPLWVQWGLVGLLRLKKKRKSGLNLLGEFGQNLRIQHREAGVQPSRANPVQHSSFTPVTDSVLESLESETETATQEVGLVSEAGPRASNPGQAGRVSVQNHYFSI
ncbi:hypothetical protein K469DRAFT_688229 [Zopfia rhizophila CBS 207.26]|uniref:Uncharacterized protein n=1 Tax=Zopfia rhizophila CBS 207.26 TaxID=1314779 RepID=A0A6A6E3C8_9PEZI|nr:hypothetical protein K469DRAFT_688229 [Zopfia rhizophila CBS 207.26]